MGCTSHTPGICSFLKLPLNPSELVRVYGAVPCLLTLSPPNTTAVSLRMPGVQNGNARDSKKA